MYAREAECFVNYRVLQQKQTEMKKRYSSLCEIRNCSVKVGVFLKLRTAIWYMLLVSIYRTSNAGISNLSYKKLTFVTKNL